MLLSCAIDKTLGFWEWEKQLEDDHKAESPRNGQLKNGVTTDS
jgi:hypothetical protein